MAYSTRRKSVNLSLLGIHVPRPVNQRSPPAVGAVVAAAAATAAPDESFQPPTKKLKRSHSDASAPEDLPESPSKIAKPSLPNVESSHSVQTPPASPPPAPSEQPQEQQSQAEPQYPKVDTEGINDEVVVATIELLQKCDNRPLMLKEIATAIAGHVHVVETSANQSAIISSRLTNFLKRPWSNVAPCPLGKDLIGTHPKRLFFYLSSRPHQPFPEPERTISATRIITPSLTSATDDDEPPSRRRSEMSPSPELTLESPDLEEEDAQLSRSTSFPSLMQSESVPTPGFAQSRTSPALERDEREFTQTAHSLQQIRRLELLEQLAKAQAFDLKVDKIVDSDPMVLEDVHDLNVDKLNQEAAQAVFEHADSLLIRNSVFLGSSPMMFAQRESDVVDKPIVSPLTLPPAVERAEISFSWAELKSPETVELDELENLFDSY